jgi:hypothetical protein
MFWLIGDTQSVLGEYYHITYQKTELTKLIKTAYMTEVTKWRLVK